MYETSFQRPKELLRLVKIEGLPVIFFSREFLHEDRGCNLTYTRHSYL